MSRPSILITPDVSVRHVLGVDRQVYEVNAVYCDAVLAAGGLPLVAPYMEDTGALEALASRCHGLVLTGGDYDLDPRLYGATPHPALGPQKPARTRFETALLRLAETRGIPVLGVCAGMQLMNVVWGGTLWQDLPDERPSPVQHRQTFDRRRTSHGVTLTPGSRMVSIYGATHIRVNSNHHQAVRDVGPGVVVSGVGEDGVVEAIEIPRLGFAVGVQWHPEMLAAEEDQGRARAVYPALVHAAREYKAGMADPGNRSCLPL